jgi:hypothetical protein
MLAAMDFAPKGGQYIIYVCFQTNRPLEYPRCKKQYCGRSVDAHYQNGAVSWWYIDLPKTATSTLVVDCRGQVAIQIPYIQDEKLLMLH